MLNYRVQLMLDARGTPAFSPRISMIAPTGNSASGLGQGGLGWQVNLPFSEQAGDTYLHWNVGFTQILSASDPGGDHDVARAHVGASAIWRVHPMVNLMMETLVEGTDRVTVSPGVRFGWNRDDAQWVIGIAAPFVRQDGATAISGLGYLSYEFPFKP